MGWRRICNKWRRKARMRALLPSIRDYERMEGFLSPLEASHLCYFASLLPTPAVVVEIGSWKGKSTYCLAQGLKRGVINAVDPFDASGTGEDSTTYEQQRGQTASKGVGLIFKTSRRSLWWAGMCCFTITAGGRRTPAQLMLCNSM